MYVPPVYKENAKYALHKALESRDITRFHIHVKYPDGRVNLKLVLDKRTH